MTHIQYIIEGSNLPIEIGGTAYIVESLRAELEPSNFGQSLPPSSLNKNFMSRKINGI
jgi:hypothetical protein